jgi:hypothetical protein
MRNPLETRIFTPQMAHGMDLMCQRRRCLSRLRAAGEIIKRGQMPEKISQRPPAACKAVKSLWFGVIAQSHILHKIVAHEMYMDGAVYSKFYKIWAHLIDNGLKYLPGLFKNSCLD